MDLGRRRATLRDLASAAGVSLAQASHALAGYEDVSAATRERVRRLAREMGYRPSARAQSFKAGKRSRQRCGVVLVGMSGPSFARTHFYGPVLAGLMANATAERMEVQLIPLPLEELERAGGAGAALRQLVAEDRADGYVLMAFAPLTPADLDAFDDVGVPFVLANRYFGERPANAVTVDYAVGMAEAVARLVALGHRRVALLLPARGRSTVHDRERGWRNGCEAAGLAPSDAPVLRYDEEAKNGARDVAARALAGGPGARPTGLVCHTDVCAHEVLVAAAAARIRVPADLSVIGFDNVVARYFTPPLCTFESHPDALGARTAALLARALRGEEDSPQHETLVPTFICRASCGPAPG